MFEYMGDRITSAIKNIRNMGKINETNISEAMREIRMALLEADVNYEVAKDFVNIVKEKALGMNVGNNLKPDELFIKIVKDELINLLGGDYVALETNKKPAVLMLVGLQGGGKTTTAGKLAKFLQIKHNRKPLLVAGDIYRPAAIDQLQEIGKNINVPVYTEGKTNPVLIAKNSLKYASDNGADYIIIDTSGRLHIDDELMNELENIYNEVKPDEVILVIDAMMGQDAINVINGFNNKLKITGCILTKMDGDTKGGVALSVRNLTNIPIKFVGDSEKIDGISEFYPERMANRILDMGDILSVAEKVENVIEEDFAKDVTKKMHKGSFDLEDFLQSMKQIKKLGPLENILKMLPQARQMGLNNVNLDPKQLAHVEAIILSMTNNERKNPDILKAQRKIRIAKGSGRSVEEINRLLKQFEGMKDMMKKMGNGSSKLPF